METLHGSNADAIVYDDRFFPVIVSTWFGKASEPSVRAYYRHLEVALSRAKAERRVLINIVDSATAEVPSADVRRLISELTREWESRGASVTTVRAIVVVESAAIRAVIRVLHWLHGGMRTWTVKSLDAAVDTTVELLHAIRQPVPPGFAPGRVARPRRP